jgi:hypothetical protein
VFIIRASSQPDLPSARRNAGARHADAVRCLQWDNNQPNCRADGKIHSIVEPTDGPAIRPIHATLSVKTEPRLPTINPFCARRL